MSSSTSGSKARPLSPFMIGPYYKPQLTSMLSITHRATGVFLTAGALLFAGWLTALAAGPEAYATFERHAGGLVGRIVMALMVFSLVYHWFNGLRHLMWDTGYGLDIPKAYATGYIVMIGSVLVTAIVLWFAMGGVA
jgi:succinate dehydrogenase / fumarate reductase, cytochrome b subunit